MQPEQQSADSNATVPTTEVARVAVKEPNRFRSADQFYNGERYMPPSSNLNLGQDATVLLGRFFR
jgi:hypothetical protein